MFSNKRRAMRRAWQQGLRAGLRAGFSDHEAAMDVAAQHTEGLYWDGFREGVVRVFATRINL